MTLRQNFPAARVSRLLAVGAVLGLTAALPACSTNPATGAQQFAGLMSPQQEKQVGDEQHAQVMAQFGGAYDNQQVASYVNQMGQTLAGQSEMPDLTFTFTVLDSPVINAFALPGGYVYVTRGLVALAENEAELAGVVAHEIGHVTARHSAVRYSQSAVAGVGVALLGVLTGSSELANVAGYGAQAYLQSYSRGQEFEADTLGVRYLTRAGYAPDAMASFLSKLDQHSRLQAQLAGKSPDVVDQTNIMATHPRTLDRVQAAQEAAGVAAVANPRIGRDTHLARIDGMLYGENPKQGFVRGQEFIHPDLRFRFTVPEGYTMVNGQTQVQATGPNGASIVFDLNKAQGNPAPRDYLAAWGKTLQISGIEQIDVNGLQGATGAARANTNRGPADVRLVAIAAGDGSFYRFAFITPPQSTQQLSAGLRETTYSLRRLSASEAGSVKPQRLDIYRVRQGDTAARLAARMPAGPLAEQRFAVLNGLEPGQNPAVGSSVKLVVE
ncbi:MAG: M48 family metalloprotease [Alphaproteobacteria bacterium]|nr:M48 family metalloprotease [Alphaproteobacteria bacterium]MBU0797289.1 M48 family metalloprotease [Alphaproteobacteria bacterium]MBU0888923.1 M48 family metalloprotease [Alphaproteobacteria bacterium]MBU1813943.1 M48 family metalloprotease [Alphaproteobacteria bacterium]